MNAKPETHAQQLFGALTPNFTELTDQVLLDDIWERPQLSKPARSLVTCAALVTSDKTEQMESHFPRPIANGVTRQERVERFHQLGVGECRALCSPCRAFAFGSLGVPGTVHDAGE